MEGDRKYVINGLKDAEISVQDFEKKILKLKKGEFLIRTQKGKTDKVQERWLLTYHKILTLDQIKIKITFTSKELNPLKSRN